MGLSGRLGSVTTKFCWAVWRALMKEKSGSSRTLLASEEEPAMRPPPLPAAARFSLVRSSSASFPRCFLMDPRSFSFSSLRRETDCCRDSRRNFFRMRDLLACSRFRSLLKGRQGEEWWRGKKKKKSQHHGSQQQLHRRPTEVRRQHPTGKSRGRDTRGAAAGKGSAPLTSSRPSGGRTRSSSRPPWHRQVPRRLPPPPAWPLLPLLRAGRRPLRRPR